MHRPAVGNLANARHNSIRVRKEIPVSESSLGLPHFSLMICMKSSQDISFPTCMAWTHGNRAAKVEVRKGQPKMDTTDAKMETKDAKSRSKN